MKRIRKSPNEGTWEVRYHVESNGGPWAMCEHKHLTYGEAMPCPHLSSCGAEIVPCLGSCPQGQPGLLHLTLRFEKRTPPHSFVWERPLASSRTRDETSAGVVMLSSYGYICRKTRGNWPISGQSSGESCTQRQEMN
jgi:hypothetical protein